MTAPVKPLVQNELRQWSGDGSVPAPTALTAHGKSRVLEVVFSDGAQFRLPFELLRVYSPSAEVMGHGPGQEVLQTGKREVTLTALEPVGHYAVRPHFSDGHDSGIFTWSYLYQLGRHQEALWQDYLQALEQAGASRDVSAVTSAGDPAAVSSRSCS